ncbi:MAG: HTH domain-containing protein, partial [Anaerolineae bacterium]|nr:HTH domain-containing protein [Anaerolineae bacterium]
MGHADNKRERLEQLERILLGGWHTPTELAQKLGCDRSTVHRYLDDLSLRGVDVMSDAGHYHLDPIAYVSNVHLTSAEALTIYLALRRFILQTSKAPDFFTEAIRKVGAVLRHPVLTEQLVQSSLILEEQRAAAKEHAELWRVLQEGWLHHTRVRLWHEKDRGQTVTEHLFEPYLFEPAVLSHGVYVIGWSCTRNE